MGGFVFPAGGAFVSHSRREPRLQPGMKALLHACDERQHGLAPEGAIGLGVIAEGVVAGQAQQQRRHAEGERDLARRARLRLGKIHVLWRKRQRLPVEPAFEQQRPSGVGRAGEIFLQLFFQPRELLVGEMRAFRPRIDEGARRALSARGKAERFIATSRRLRKYHPGLFGGTSSSISLSR
jgi:hypothetical protein